MLLNNQSHSDLDETINIYNNLFLKLTLAYQVIFYLYFSLSIFLKNQKNIESRLSYLAALTENLEECKSHGVHERDLYNLKETLSHLAETLAHASKNEIDVLEIKIILFNLLIISHLIRKR